MKVLLINGSPRENGNTFTALSEVAKTLNSEGVDTEIIGIALSALFPIEVCKVPFFTMTSQSPYLSGVGSEYSWLTGNG